MVWAPFKQQQLRKKNKVAVGRAGTPHPVIKSPTLYRLSYILLIIEPLKQLSKFLAERKTKTRIDVQLISCIPQAKPLLIDMPQSDQESQILLLDLQCTFVDFATKNHNPLPSPILTPQICISTSLSAILACLAILAILWLYLAISGYFGYFQQFCGYFGRNNLKIENKKYLEIF